MANGELCKTCGFQEASHQMPNMALRTGLARKGDSRQYNFASIIPDYRVTRKWDREQIKAFFLENGVLESEIDEMFFDIIRCAGFSTTRKPIKDWVSFAED